MTNAPEEWQLTGPAQRSRAPLRRCTFCAQLTAWPLRLVMKLSTTAGPRHAHEVCLLREQTRQMHLNYLGAQQLVAVLLASCGGTRRVTAEAIKRAQAAKFEYDVEQTADGDKVLRLKGSVMIELSTRMPNRPPPGKVS